MSDFGPLHEQYTRDLVRQRAARSAHHRGSAPVQAPAERRTARRTLARGLHALADRLDG
jgi:hypothetical protein